MGETNEKKLNSRKWAKHIPYFQMQQKNQIMIVFELPNEQVDLVVVFRAALIQVILVIYFHHFLVVVLVQEEPRERDKILAEISR
jgi:hypothetical protein